MSASIYDIQSASIYDIEAAASRQASVYTACVHVCTEPRVCGHACVWTRRSESRAYLPIYL
jgi:hypothetical protein